MSRYRRDERHAMGEYDMATRCKNQIIRDSCEIQSLSKQAKAARLALRYGSTER